MCFLASRLSYLGFCVENMFDNADNSVMLTTIVVILVLQNVSLQCAMGENG